MQFPRRTFLCAALITCLGAVASLQAKKTLPRETYTLAFVPSDASGNPLLGSQLFATAGPPPVSLLGPGDLYSVSVTVGGVPLGSTVVTSEQLTSESLYEVPNDPSLIGLDVQISITNLTTEKPVATLTGTIQGGGQ